MVGGMRPSSWTAIGLAALFSATSICAQSPVFEVASIKLQPWDGHGSVGVTVRGNTLMAEHACLYDLVEFAYEAAETRVSGGPSWAMHAPLAGATLYQVRAKAAGDRQPTMDEFRLMTRALLAERFRLKVGTLGEMSIPFKQYPTSDGVFHEFVFPANFRDVVALGLPR